MIVGFVNYSYPRLDLSYEVAAGLTIGGIVNNLTGERLVETIPDYMRIMGAK